MSSSPGSTMLQLLSALQASRFEGRWRLQHRAQLERPITAGCSVNASPDATMHSVAHRNPDRILRRNKIKRSFTGESFTGTHHTSAHFIHPEVTDSSGHTPEHSGSIPFIYSCAPDADARVIHTGPTRATTEKRNRHHETGDPLTTHAYHNSTPAYQHPHTARKHTCACTVA